MNEFFGLFINDAEWFIGTIIFSALVVVLIYCVYQAAKGDQ